MATPTRMYTPDDLLALPDGDRYELVDGELKERTVSYLSSWVGLRFGHALAAYEDEHGGSAIGADIGLTIFPWDPDLLRRPDAAYLRPGRRDPLEGAPDSGYLAIPPDVVVEVVSPNDIAGDVERKVRDYLRAGVRLVWVAYPETRTVHVYRQGGDATVLDDAASLSGEAVLPGFDVPLARLFPRPADDTRTASPLTP